MTLIMIDKMVEDKRMFRVVSDFKTSTFLATHEELVEMRKTLDLMIGETK